MQHLRGVAPQMDVYRRPPLPAVIRPILPGLWSPSRSFDPHADIAAVVKAETVRTLCVGPPDDQAPQPVVAVPPTSRCGRRSVPLPHLRRSRSDARFLGCRGTAQRPWGRAAHRAQSVFRRCSRPRSCRSAPCHRRLKATRGTMQRPSGAGARPRGTVTCVDDQVPRTQAHFWARARIPRGSASATPLRGTLRGCRRCRRPRSTSLTGLGISCGERGWNGRTDPSGACVRSCFSQESTMVGHPCG
jgi:hypothetical protein